MGGLSIPQAISLIGNIPLEICERAWTIAEDYAEYHVTDAGSERWYAGKWNVTAERIGVGHAYRFAQQEIIAVFGEDAETYEKLSDWLDAWHAAARKGEN